MEKQLPIDLCTKHNYFLQNYNWRGKSILSHVLLFNDYIDCVEEQNTWAMHLVHVHTCFSKAGSLGGMTIYYHQ